MGRGSAEKEEEQVGEEEADELLEARIWSVGEHNTFGKEEDTRISIFLLGVVASRIKNNVMRSYL